MPENDNSAIVAQEWIVKAEGDLKTAAHMLKLGDKCPADIVCFHAQQCVEKYVKGFLVVLKIGFPKTHDIEALLALLPKSTHIPLSVEDQRRLTDYATVTRYPGGYEPLGLSEATQAIKLARQVRRTMRKLMQELPLF